MVKGAILKRVTPEFRVALPPALTRELEALVAEQRTLDEVVRWGLSLVPPAIVADVIVQDEYTHDVVMPHPAGVFLVYDTT